MKTPSDRLLDYLLQFGSLNQQQTELIRNSVQVKTLRKGEFFLQAGQVAREIGFITGGVFRVLYYDRAGNEVTRYFVEENQFIVDLNSYTNHLPTSEYIEALTDCELVIFSRRAMETLSQTILVWDAIIQKITAKALSDKVYKISLMMPGDARSRYEFFLEKFPNLANRVPLQYIASYIGITKSSLSRIRREMDR